jgi:hypothetical protein
VGINDIMRFAVIAVLLRDRQMRRWSQIWIAAARIEHGRGKSNKFSIFLSQTAMLMQIDIFIDFTRSSNLVSHP